MSNEVYGVAKRRVVGSATIKAVLLMMADSASDDGSGIWISKANIARDLELSKRAVQLAIASLIEIGVVAEVGQKACHNGFTIEYRINVKALSDRPSTRESGSPLPVNEVRRVNEVHPYPCTTFTPTREPDSPKPSFEPSFEPSLLSIDVLKEVEDQSQDRSEKQFEEFWAAFPRRTAPSSKKNTLARFKAALKKVSFENLMIAAKAYARSREGEDPQFTKGAEPWLNGEFWTVWLTGREGGSPAPAEPNSKYAAIIAKARAANHHPQ